MKGTCGMKGTHYNHGFGGFMTPSDSGPVSGAPMDSNIRRQTDPLGSSGLGSSTRGAAMAASPTATPAPTAGGVGVPVSGAPASSRILRQTPVVGGGGAVASGATAAPKDQTIRAGTRARAGSPTQTVQLAAARFRGSQQAVGSRQAESAPFDYSPTSKVARTNLGY